VQIINKTNNSIISTNAQLADTVISRLVGLLNRAKIDSQEALIITHCRSIHMFFMRFAIDAIFVDKNNTVVGLVKNIKPFMMSPYFFRSSYVIELPSGKIEATQTKTGDSIVFEEK